MKVLYISPQHVSGTLQLWQQEHRRRGNECRFLTLFKSPFGFPEDISLNLPLHPDKGWILNARRFHNRITRGPLSDDTPVTGKPPFRPPLSTVEKVFFNLRDFINSPRILEALRKFDLDSFDIIHLDQGQGLFRDARILKRWFADGKRIVSFYHGSDMRNRGIFRNVDELTHLRITSEVDLLFLDDRLEYLFLPFDTSKFTPEERLSKTGKLKIVHAARVRAFKGTDHIEAVVKKLEKNYPVEFVLLENVPHNEAMKIKQECDIAVDQIADTGGWGYGMSSVEYLSMGIPTCTSMVQEMIDFIPDHPFIPVTAETLEEELIKLIEDEEYRFSVGSKGREWVEKYHDIQSVGNRLYGYYSREGWIE